MEKDIAEKQDELEAVQKERVGQENAIDAIAKDIADAERRLQVPSTFLAVPSPSELPVDGSDVAHVVFTKEADMATMCIASNQNWA